MFCIRKQINYNTNNETFTRFFAFDNFRTYLIFSIEPTEIIGGGEVKNYLSSIPSTLINQIKCRIFLPINVIRSLYKTKTSLYIREKLVRNLSIQIGHTIAKREKLVFQTHLLYQSKKENLFVFVKSTNKKLALGESQNQVMLTAPPVGVLFVHK